jgi:hypothetical protein
LLLIARTRVVGIAVGVVAAVQAAMLPFAFIDTSHGVGWIHLIPLGDRIGQVPLQFAVQTLERRTTSTVGLVGGAILVVVVLLLIALGGDRRARHGATVGAVIAAAVLLAPLALGYVGEDYFLARNLLPAFTPLMVVIAAACVARRTRILGAVLAVALLALFGFATLDIAEHPDLQRPDWRKLARVLGTAPVTRAILAADGTAADPLKIFLPNVNWAADADGRDQRDRHRRRAETPEASVRRPGVGGRSTWDAAPAVCRLAAAALPGAGRERAAGSHPL